MKKHSTGALTKQQHEIQDKCYQEGHKYDYLILGTGMAALTLGSLLANAGFRVCMLEAHDVPGGYAHNFYMNGFNFCAQVHYIWGCAPGKMVYEFLKHLGLEEEIEFNAYDPQCYDLAALPDGKRVGIPYGFKNLIDNIDRAYPGEREKLEKFIKIIETISHEVSQMPQGKIKWWQLVALGYQFRTLIKYRNRTLQDLFDECGLSMQARAILNAQSGDLGAPPQDLSAIAFSALLCGYNEGAYYPTKHFKFFIERLAGFISAHPGCHIYYETEVNAIEVSGDHVISVKTCDGKTFTAEKIVCNMDPQKTSYLIGRDKFPKSYLPPLSYEYSPAAFNIYLGVKDYDLREHGFGDCNVWSIGQWDLNRMWQEMMEDKHDAPLIFMSTPSLHSTDRSVAPEGCDILEVITVTNYKHFEKLSPKDYRHKKRELSQKLLDMVEQQYLPELQKHIALKVTGTPTTSEDFCYAPCGNAYGSNMTPYNIGLHRLTAETPWSNFYWCNASSGYAGINGTIFTGAYLYMNLTDDRFYHRENQPSADDAIRYAKTRAHRGSPQKEKVTY